MRIQKRESSPKTKEEIAFVKRLGNRIAEAAAKRKVSIERLAYEGGVSKGYLYDLVKGKGNPSIVILHRIAQALDAKVSDLIG